MQEMIRVAVDAMGGDNAPDEIIKGAIEAVALREDIQVILVGREELIREKLKSYSYREQQVEVVNATEVIETAEPPVAAIRTKKDSSIVVGLKLVKEEKADAFVSAGSSGAVLAGGQLLVGRIKGVERPPLAPLIPTEKGVSLLIDCGANVDARPSHLVQFAKMGSIYMEHVMGVKNPRVAIVNIGAEEEKGNALVKETFPLLKECDGLNFIGNIEARDLQDAVCDVIVTDGFTGNVIIKLTEGMGLMVLRELKSRFMSSTRSKMGALLLGDQLRAIKSEFDYAEYGGAPILGVKGALLKMHGSSDARAVEQTILKAVPYVNENVVGTIGSAMTEIVAREGGNAENHE